MFDSISIGEDNRDARGAARDERSQRTHCIRRSTNTALDSSRPGSACASELLNPREKNRSWYTLKGVCVIEKNTQPTG